MINKDYLVEQSILVVVKLILKDITKLNELKYHCFYRN